VHFYNGVLLVKSTLIKSVDVKTRGTYSNQRALKDIEHNGY
jgi:hypothetical protein